MKALLFLIIILNCACSESRCKNPGMPWSHLPVVLELNNSIDEIHLTAIKRAANLLEQQTGIHIFQITSNSSLNEKITVSVLRVWNLAERSQQGNTTLYFRDGTAFKADIKINAKDFEYFIGYLSAPGRINLESLYVHELGHALGLMHSDSAESVMYPTLAYGKIRTKLSSADINTLKCFYKKP